MTISLMRNEKMHYTLIYGQITEILASSSIFGVQRADDDVNSRPDVEMWPISHCGLGYGVDTMFHRMHF